MLNSGSWIGAISYAAGALAFAALLAPLLANWRGRLQPGLLALACAATFAWCAGTSYGYLSGAVPGRILGTAEILRNVSWIAFLWSALSPEGDDRLPRPWRAAFLLPAAASLFLAALAFERFLPPLLGIGGSQVPLYVRLMLSVAGLVLTESLYRNTPAEERWGIKFLCLAVGGIFVYDLVLHADAIIFRRAGMAMMQARGAVQALVAPLLAVAIVRSRVWRADIHVSRQVALHSTALIAGGIYLFLMAVVGFYVRRLGGVSGPALQVIYLFGALALLAAILFSGTVRAYLRVFLSKHFYSHKYDYREEWLRFMRTLSADHGRAVLEERAVKAIADIVDSPAGAMWRLEGNRYAPAAPWNLTPPPRFGTARDGAFAQFMASRQWIIDIGEIEARPDKYDGLSLPPELAGFARAWLVVPLWHHGLTGFVVLTSPRAPRKLGWEDYDLLKTVGRQAASYIAEQRASQALDEVREFEIFNRRFAFVIHDIKNLVSQLSLGAANLEKHGDDPAFREDLTKTVKDATEKMKRLIGRINAAGGDDPGDNVHVRPLIEELIESRPSGAPPIGFECDAPDLLVAGDRDRIASVMQHLIQNATDAADGGGGVRVSLRRSGDAATIDVIDTGPGMDRAFMRDELFKPFRSSKQSGMGIGAFQCREYVREMGGELDAISEPGRGTTMRVTLPVAKSGARESAISVPAGPPA